MAGTAAQQEGPRAAARAAPEGAGGGNRDAQPAPAGRTPASLSTKITLVVVGVTLVALLVAAAALLRLEASSYYEREFSVHKALADVVGKASAAALTFGDVKVGEKTLELLKEHPSVKAAALYRPDGSLFTAFVRDERGTQPVPQSVFEAHRHTVPEALELLQVISDESEDVGSIYVRARYTFYDRLWNYAAVLAAVMLMSGLVAGLLTLWLRRFVMRPIEDLTRAARDVIARRDFSVRVRRMSSDEVGHLVDAFNLMLHEVGLRTAALEQSEAKLVEADRRKDEFLATLAHELRNPLAPLRNSIELFKITNLNPEVVERAVPMMDRQIAQMTRLVNDLLDVARITSGKLALDPTLIDFRDVVADAVETVQPLIAERSDDLRISLPGEPVPVHGDAVRLAQVLANLLNNALKFTPPGGSVGLAVALAGEQVRVVVSDTGAGMSPELLGRIFVMFAQGGDASGLRSGLGVGLALSRQLVMLHGGEITAASDGEGRGSVFTITLPACNAGAQTQRAAPATDVDAVSHRLAPGRA